MLFFFQHTTPYVLETAYDGKLSYILAKLLSEIKQGIPGFNELN